MTARSPYLLRYHANGQIMFNDPRIVQAFGDLLTDARVLTETDIIDGRGMHCVGVFYDESDTRHGMAGANVIGVGRTPLKALRNAMGWHFGSADYAHVARSTHETFDATHDDQLVTR